MQYVVFLTTFNSIERSMRPGQAPGKGSRGQQNSSCHGPFRTVQTARFTSAQWHYALRRNVISRRRKLKARPHVRAPRFSARVTAATLVRHEPDLAGSGRCAAGSDLQPLNKYGDVFAE